MQPLAPVQDELNKLVDLKGVINAIPDLTKADLVDLSVLTAGANVVKSVGASGKRKLIGRATGGSFVDVRAARGVTYVYVVRAVNEAGAGPFSTSVRARRL